jgi:hypothetical protein
MGSIATQTRYPCDGWMLARGGIAAHFPHRGIVYSATLGVYGLAAALVTSFRPRPNMTAPAARSTQDLYDR